MHQSLRKISGGFQANFQLVQTSLIINITHPLQNRVYFSRLSDHSLPENLKQIADTSKQLYELISDTPDDKLVVNANDALVILVDVGKKVKEYAIPMEKVDISHEEALKKRVEDLEKELQRKDFEARFYKEQYQFLLEHLQLQPDIEQLERIYKKNVGSFLSQKEMRMSKAQSMFEKESDKTMSSISAKSSKVGSGIKNQKQPLKCKSMHPLASQPAPHPYFKCNICRQSISMGSMKYSCRPCDFDACQNCISIPPQNRKYCPKQHALVFGSAKNYLVRSCDVCRSSLAFSKAFTCLECDYDICKQCLK